MRNTPRWPLAALAALLVFGAATAQAQVYAALGAHHLAAPAYRRAIALLDRPPAALLAALGSSLLALGDRTGAATAFGRALRRDSRLARRGYRRATGRVTPIAGRAAS